MKLRPEQIPHAEHDRYVHYSVHDGMWQDWCVRNMDIVRQFDYGYAEANYELETWSGKKVIVDSLSGRFGSTVDVMQCIAEVGNYPYQDEDGLINLAPAEWIRSIRQIERTPHQGIQFPDDDAVYTLAA